MQVCCVAKLQSYIIARILLQSYCYLLHADGQKIAKKLSRQVTSETKRLRTLLEEYNTCQLVVSSSLIQITLDEALDPEVLFSKLHADTTSSKPHQDILEAYLQMKCSNEEIVLLESEMANTIHFLC